MTLYLYWSGPLSLPWAPPLHPERHSGLKLSSHILLLSHYWSGSPAASLTGRWQQALCRDRWICWVNCAEQRQEELLLSALLLLLHTAQFFAPTACRQVFLPTLCTSLLHDSQGCLTTTLTAVWLLSHSPKEPLCPDWSSSHSDKLPLHLRALRLR